MDERVPYMVFAGLAAAGGLLWFVQSFRDRRIQRLIQDTPTARIRSMAMGLVELTGRTVARSGMVAPFSGRPCVYWELDIATRSGSGRNRSWRVVHRNSSGHPFYLQDDTGLALVYPRGVECRLPFGVQEETGGLFALPECYADYMKRENLGMATLWRMGPMRFRERILEEGQVAYVLGRANPRASSHAVALPDEDALQATGTEHLRSTRIASLDEGVRGVIRKAPADPVFLLSLSSERSMAMEYQIRALAGSVLGPALFVGGIAFLLWVAAQR